MVLIIALIVGRSESPFSVNVSAAEEGVNLLINPSFEGLGAPNQWQNPWMLSTQYGFLGSLSQDLTTSVEGLASARVGIAGSVSTAPNVVLVQNNFQTETGVTYNIDFWAKSAASRQINVMVQDGTGSGIFVHQYMNTPVTLTTAWQRYTLTYMSSQNLVNTFLIFGVGQSQPDVWFDDVYMGAGPRPASPTPTATPTLTSTPTATPTATPTPDIQAPLVAVTFPTNGGKVKKDTNVTIQATASDNVAVTQVRFYVDNVLKCSDSVAPYSCLWHVPNPNSIYYTLTANAEDLAGNIGVSAAVVVKSIK